MRTESPVMQNTPLVNWKRPPLPSLFFEWSLFETNWGRNGANRTRHKIPVYGVWAYNCGCLSSLVWQHQRVTWRLASKHWQTASFDILQKSTPSCGAVEHLRCEVCSSSRINEWTNLVYTEWRPYRRFGGWGLHCRRQFYQIRARPRTHGISRPFVHLVSRTLLHRKSGHHGDSALGRSQTQWL
jgi:hypothetical protein